MISSPLLSEFVKILNNKKIEILSSIKKDKISTFSKENIVILSKNTNKIFFIAILYLLTILTIIPSSALTQKDESEALRKAAVVKAEESKNANKNPIIPATTEPSSCLNPVGWIEDVPLRTESGNYYQTNDNPSKYVYCGSTTKVNYKDVNTNKVEKINNKINTPKNSSECLFCY